METVHKDYTDKDIIEWFIQNIKVQKTRKREYLDQRNYVIAVLYQKFNYSENSIASLFNIDRSSVSHCKRHAYTLLVEYSDDNFIRNTSKLIANFPYDFEPTNTGGPIEDYLRRVDIKNIDSHYYRKLIRLASYNGLTKEAYIKNILYKTLDFITEY